tara:strand:- start:2804 stop:3538 length:735 start_codon:yes stop_codon:yes gene_type:complete
MDIMTQSLAAQEREHGWQLRLMPFMIGLILTLALFFFAATLFQLYELNLKIQDAPKLPNSELLQQASTGATLMEKQWRTLVVLESHTLQQRYHQANVLLMARIWIRYLGFVTGMMLALIGAVFILGKLREPTTTLTLSGESQDSAIPGNFKAQLLTQSPGIVLVTLGTGLMLITILVHHQIQVNDVPVYTSVTALGKISATQSKPAELDLGSAGPQQPSGVDQTAALLEQARKRHEMATGGDSQ